MEELIVVWPVLALIEAGALFYYALRYHRLVRRLPRPIDEEQEPTGKPKGR